MLCAFFTLEPDWTFLKRCENGYAAILPDGVKMFCKEELEKLPKIRFAKPVAPYSRSCQKLWILIRGNSPALSFHSSTTCRVNLIHSRGPATEFAKISSRHTTRKRGHGGRVTSQLRAEPLMPTACSSLFKRILWSNISKAEDISNKIKTAGRPESAIKRRLLKTLSRAVLVLWCGSKPDWNLSLIFLCLSRPVVAKRQFSLYVSMFSHFDVEDATERGVCKVF